MRIKNKEMMGMVLVCSNWWWWWKRVWPMLLLFLELPSSLHCGFGMFGMSGSWKVFLCTSHHQPTCFIRKHPRVERAYLCGSAEQDSASVLRAPQDQCLYARVSLSLSLANIWVPYASSPAWANPSNISGSFKIMTYTNCQGQSELNNV